MLQEIYILDLLGTSAFAMYGSYFAIKKEFDIFGIILAAFLTAAGGGTIRDLILNQSPFYFHDMNYIILILCSVVFTILIYKTFDRIRPFANFADSLGLVTFAFIGATKGYDAELGLFGITALATVSAIGGGILRDVILNEIPSIMRSDFYASVAILLGILYGLFADKMHTPLWANTLIMFCLIIRLLFTSRNIHLWVPRRNKKI